jgi:hypothetical protein
MIGTRVLILEIDTGNAKPPPFTGSLLVDAPSYLTRVVCAPATFFRISAKLCPTQHHTTRICLSLSDDSTMNNGAYQPQRGGRGFHGGGRGADNPYAYFRSQSRGYSHVLPILVH